MTDQLSLWKKTIRRLLWNNCRLLFPSYCGLCGREISNTDGYHYYCEDCLKQLVPQPWQGCSRCAGTLVETVINHHECALCRGKRLHFDAAVALGNYHAGLNLAVIAIKNPRYHRLAKSLGDLLAEQRHEQLLAYKADLIVPVPMFWRRRLVRGTNSAEILAQRLGRALKLPVRKNVLKRNRHTLPQAGLSPRKRLLNLRNAFDIKIPQDVENKRILLVDDILTTGTTCSEAAKVLKKHGAVFVAAAVLARAEGRL